MAKDFETRLASVRDELDRLPIAERDERTDKLNMVEEQLFQNGWPNCWGSFANIMP
jgi:hypothetical protein